MAEVVETLVQISDTASVCDDFEVIEPDIGSPSRRSFHDDFETDQTPTASPTQSILLNTMSIDGGSEKSFQLTKIVHNEEEPERFSTPTPDDNVAATADMHETPIMTESMSDFSVTSPKAVLEAVRNLEKMFESHVMNGSTMTSGIAELASLKEENEELRDQLSTAKKINKRLMDSLEEKTEDLQHIRKVVTKEMNEASEVRISELIRKIEENGQEKALLMQKQHAIEIEKERLLSDNLQLKKVYQDQQAMLAEMQQKFNALRDQSSEAQQNQNRLSVDEMNAISALKLEIDHLHAKVAEKDEMMEAMKRAEKFAGKHRSHRGRGHSSGVDEEALVTTLRDKVEYIGALEIEIKQLREQITRNQTEMANKEEIIKVLQEENLEGTRLITERDRQNRQLLDQMRDRHYDTGLSNF